MERKILISYDKEADVMYLSFGEPVEAIAEEIDEGVFARYAQDQELVGLTIINFSQKFGIEPKEVAIPIYKE